MKKQQAKQRTSRVPARVVVPNVRVCAGTIQRVIFRFNKAKKRFVAKTKGFPIIRVEERDDGKFHAWNGAVDVKANAPDKAFARATRRLWTA